MSKYMYMYISRCDVEHMNQPYHTYEHNFHGTWPVNDIAIHCNTLQYIATHCNTLQHTAERCSTLQHTTTYSSTNRMPPPEFGGPTKKQKTCEQTHHAASCCNTLQHTAIYYNTLVNERECDLQRSRAMPSIKDMRTNKRINLQHAATHTATYCNIVYEYECNLKRSGATPSIKDMRTNKRITSATPSSSALV